MKKLLCGFMLVFLVGCTDAQMGQLNALGKPGRLTLYSGGKAVRSWVSTGVIQTEQHSDGYYFVDKETNHLIRVSGDIVIEQ